MPYTRATIVRAKIREEIFETVSVVSVGDLDHLPIVSLLATIATHHNTIIASQIDATNVGVIEILERPSNISTSVDSSLRSVEFSLELS